MPRSLVWATDIDTLPIDRIVVQREGFVLVRSPSNPGHYWGNLLILEESPAAGDGARWEALFEAEFADEPRVRHQTFAWDLTEPVLGAAREEFEPRGYTIEEHVGLVAVPAALRPHPRENRDVFVRPLDPSAGADEGLWAEVVELQVGGREEGHDEREYRTFARTRLEDRRTLFRAGRGAWYVAIDSGGTVVGSCGIVVTDGRGRYQAVDTAVGHRRRGVASRLLVSAGRHAAAAHDAGRLVIVADPSYHALGLYESLGFARAEHVVGVCQWPKTGVPRV